jgi:hypothetical protein
MIRLRPTRSVLAVAIYLIVAPVLHGGSPRDQGIWKAAVPAAPMHGEFDGLDPMGVAAGVRIKADCSLNWVSPDDGKRYCFASGTSLQYFLDAPQGNIERARQAWHTLQSHSP